jgi:hypothetical protein
MDRNEALFRIGLFIVAALSIALCTYLAGHIMGGFLFCGLAVSLVYFILDCDF